MAITLQETTKWEGKQENHTYYVNDTKEKLIAFKAAGTDTIITYSKPLQFNTRGRTFNTIKL
jgi:hypothetical protein